jgi:hypothetical protein
VAAAEAAAVADVEAPAEGRQGLAGPAQAARVAAAKPPVAAAAPRRKERRVAVLETIPVRRGVAAGASEE